MSQSNDPIVFISHSRVKPGKLNGLRDFLRDGTAALQAGKPRTRAFLAYLDDDATKLTIVHVFGDAESMAAHIEGAHQRSTAASEFIETTAIDIYGMPTEPILAAMRAISGSGVALQVRPDYVGGFLRLTGTHPVRG